MAIASSATAATLCPLDLGREDHFLPDKRVDEPLHRGLEVAGEVEQAHLLPGPGKQRRKVAVRVEVEQPAELTDSLVVIVVVSRTR